jgi:acetyltransferase-like isoleucine patch superfamily enzyme
MAVRIHPLAEIEDDVEIGDGTAIWAHVHARSTARIGAGCIIGEKTYIAGEVVVGDLCKVNAFVYLCSGVTLERGVMVAAGVTFTNDRFPRATTPDLAELRPSEIDEHTRPTLVKEGATIGARSVIGSDLSIGRFAMVGMGSVVTRAVPDFHLVVGAPARSIAVVCRCGEPVLRFGRAGGDAGEHDVECGVCGRGYHLAGRAVTER